MAPAYNTFRQDLNFQHGSTSFESLVAKFILNSSTNWLLLSIAPAALCYHASLSEGATALFSLLALIPLSERLSFSAGLLSLYFSSKWALPLQICLNNLTELFICAVALYFGLKRFVVLYLIGSSWFCTLFIIGTTLLYAGWYFDTIRFHTNLTHTYSMLLVFLAACIATPEVIYDGGESSFLQIEGFTRAIAIILLLVYISYIVFQVKSHSSFFANPEIMPFTLWAGKKDGISGGNEAIVANVTSQMDDRPVSASTGSQRSRRDASNRMQIGSSPVPSVDSSATALLSSEIEWTPVLLTFTSVFLVVVCTFFTWIAVILTATIARVSSEDFLLDLSPSFFVVILLPMATNLGRMQATSTLARSGKYSEIINLMLETAVQSSFFVLPVMILISWMSKMHMTLDVGAFESAIMFSTALVLNGALRMGESNWLVGTVLLILYAMITVGYWARSSDSLSS